MLLRGKKFVDYACFQYGAYNATISGKVDAHFIGDFQYFVFTKSAKSLEAIRILMKKEKYETGRRVLYMELEKIKAIIAEVLNIDADSITADTTFVDDLGADSLDIFQIIMGIEEEYDIELENEAVEQIQTVGDAVEALRAIK